LLKIIKRAFAGLKTHKYHIIFSWILLTCFIAGQYMVYSHQHNTVKGIHYISKDLPKQTVTEKCQLCDVMHHNTMVKTNLVYFNPVKVIGHVFKSVDYNFTDTQLILSFGRAPPSEIYCI
jgi:hypothetical protein